jgi:hypothetical protein
LSTTIPPKASLTGSPLWSDGTPFDGYVLLGLVMPQNADGQWPTLALEGVFPPVSLPIWTQIPISAGVFDPNSFVWLNTSVSPGHTQYVAYWYDLNKRRIFPATGTPPTPFTITTTAFAINIPTLTTPATSATLPTPVDSATGGI